MGATGSFVYRKDRDVVIDTVKQLYICDYERIADFAFVPAPKSDGRQTVYLAIEDTRNNSVTGAVILYYFRAANIGYDFGYELVTRFEGETCGPVVRRCPNRILKQLSPTDEQWALEWRNDSAYYNRTKRDRYSS